MCTKHSPHRLQFVSDIRQRDAGTPVQPTTAEAAPLDSKPSQSPKNSTIGVAELQKGPAARIVVYNRAVE